MPDMQTNALNNPRVDNAEWRWVIISSGLLMLLTLLPYLVAFSAAVPDHRFMGSLFNPLDGATYLSKMAQGAGGDWQLHLSYTPEPHEPVFLYTFYLLLGHITTWLALPPVLVYHTIRLTGAFVMLLMLYQFTSKWTSDFRQRQLTWGLAAVSGGFGWLLIGTGTLTPDVTVPEGFLLFAAYTNAHFPWIIAVLIYLAHTLSSVVLEESHGWPSLTSRALGIVTATIFLMSLAPYTLAPVGMGIATVLGWLWWRNKQFPKREFLWAIIVPIVALPQLIYGLWAISEANPVLHAWSQQNLTLSPPVWQYLVAYGPLLLLALPAIWKSWSRFWDGEHNGDIFLLAWLVINALLLYAPLNLQRRFATGLIVPLAIFAGRGIARVILPLFKQRWRFLITAAIFILSAPSTVLVLALSTQGIATLDEGFYIRRDEEDTLMWLGAHSDQTDVVLAPPSLSLFVPIEAPARVVYGHPFETINPAERLAAVKAFYSGVDCTVAQDEPVTFIVWDSQQAANDACLPDSEPVFSTGSITVFATDE